MIKHIIFNHNTQKFIAIRSRLAGNELFAAITIRLGHDDWSYASADETITLDK